jgi:hypothetical protein
MKITFAENGYNGDDFIEAEGLQGALTVRPQVDISHGLAGFRMEFNKTARIGRSPVGMYSMTVMTDMHKTTAWEITSHGSNMFDRVVTPAGTKLAYDFLSNPSFIDDVFVQYHSKMADCYDKHRGIQLNILEREIEDMVSKVAWSEFQVHEGKHGRKFETSYERAKERHDNRDKIA